MLSPDHYEIVDVRTSTGVRRAMLFPKVILQAEFAVNAPSREVLAIRRERSRAKRAAAKQRLPAFGNSFTHEKRGGLEEPPRRRP